MRAMSAVFLMAVALAGCGSEPEEPPALPLPVITVADKALPLALNYTARTRGEREVEVRARTNGKGAKHVIWFATV